MSQLTLPRRSFLIGFGSLLMAPAIVKIENIMSIKSLPKILQINPNFDPMYIGMMISFNEEMFKITGISSIEYFRPE